MACCSEKSYLPWFSVQVSVAAQAVLLLYSRSQGDNNDPWLIALSSVADVFGCLSRRELRAFPVINDFKNHSLSLFVKDVNVKSDLQYALEDSVQLLGLVRNAPAGSILTLSYVANDNNDTETVFLQVISWS